MTRSTLFALLTTAGLLMPIALPSAALAQQLVDLNPPLNGTSVAADTPISGQFENTGNVTVDPNSVRVYVNGQDVTNRSTITRNFFTYRPDRPLPTGQNQVRVTYRSSTGDQRSTSWTFNVQQAAAAVQITSVTHNAVTPLQTGATLNITINGTPGAEATVILLNYGQSVRQLQARETSPGVYVATLNVQRRDQYNEGIAVARLRRQNQTTYAAAPQPVLLNTSNTGSGLFPGSSNSGTSPTTPPSTVNLQPRITSPASGARVGNSGFRVVGQTRPNATVQISVVYGVSLLGLDVGRATLVNREVTADANGRFELDVPAPPLPVPGLQYQIRATAKEGNQTSPETQLNVRS